MTPTTLPTELVIRSIAGEVDLPAMAAVAQRCNQADHVDERPTVEELTAWLRHLVNADPQEDILLAEVGGRLAGYQYTGWRLELTGTYIYTLAGYVDPDFRRQGLGTALVERGEARLRAVAAGHPAGSPHAFQTFTGDTRVGKLALFERRGYHAERHFYEMLHTGLDALPAVALPPGLELRPVDRNDRTLLHSIWLAGEEAFRDHWGNSEANDEQFLRLMDSPDTDTDLWQVAWDTANNEMAGLAINMIPSEENAALGRVRGWVDDLSVRRPYRRRGLGRALLLASLHALRARGVTEGMLGVDAENPTGALGLYESAGFKPIHHSVALRKAL